MVPFSKSLDRLATVILVGIITALAAGPAVRLYAQDTPQNIVFILSDDHRYDLMGFHPNAPDFLETPSMDRMAREGMHVRNAFVTTALCSPSRASILTGRYAHHHGIVDNSSPIPAGTRFFPADLQKNGYKTAFIGKLHMGEVDDRPQPGFDQWVSFRGQGVYHNPTLNVNGRQVKREGYVTDLLTDYALDWLGSLDKKQPFMMVLSHKAVHAEFEPAQRHIGKYKDVRIRYPASMAATENNYRDKPHWVRAQRYSWHGVDYMYHGSLVFDDFYRQYNETLLALDESIGRVLDYLTANGLAENTLVVYTSDNGFLLGEHGLIDKRNAYEESIRVPMLIWSPGYVRAGSTLDEMVRNIDIAPTFLELTRTRSDLPMDGKSFLPLLNGNRPAAADTTREFLYEYYWEHAFPHTPTTFALRNDRYKFIFYHGIWDINELYDLQADPGEQTNLVFVPSYKKIAVDMQKRLFDLLEDSNALAVPMRRPTYQAGERLLAPAGGFE